MQTLVTKEGQQYGPYELSKLQEYVTQGSFSLTDHCWQEGWPDWRPLSTIISSPPPPVLSSEKTLNEKSETKRNDKNAIASLVLGILALFLADRWEIVVTVLLAIPAIVSGHHAKARIKRDPQHLKGKGMAIAGLILGYIVVAGTVTSLLVVMLHKIRR